MKKAGRNAVRGFAACALVATLLLTAAPLAGGCVFGPKKVTATDDAGRVITLERAPRKIVSMAPSNTEILFALGLGSRVVGVTNFCNYPPEAASVAKVGDSYSPDYEKIVSLEPDLVLAVGTADSQVVKGLEGYGLKVFVLQTRTVSQVADDIELVGKICRAEKAAKDLADELRDRIRAVAGLKAGLPATELPTVFWCLDSELWTVGPKSFVADVIAMAGGRNVGADLGTDYGQFSMESLLEVDPDVIIIPVLGASVPANLAKLAGWGTLTAVKEGRVYQVHPDVVSRPGPRIAEAVEEVAALLHPGVSGGGSK